MLKWSWSSIIHDQSFVLIHIGYEKKKKGRLRASIKTNDLIDEYSLVDEIFSNSSKW